MFYVGQAVRCVDARQSSGALRAGAIYTVEELRGSFISIDACRGPHAGFYRFRFRPAPSIDGLRAILQTQPKERVSYDKQAKGQGEACQEASSRIESEAKAG